MITIGREHNPHLIKDVIVSIWDYIIDDTEILPEEYEPLVTDESRWYYSEDDGELYGLYWVHRLNHVTWQIHTNVLPEHWGDGRSRDHARKLLAHVFQDTGAEKLVAQIPAISRNVLEYAVDVGFQIEGCSDGVWQKNGELYDMFYLGLNKHSIGK